MVLEHLGRRGHITHDLLIGLYTLSVIAPLGVLLMSIYTRRAARSLYFSYMSLAIFIFTLGYLFEITSRDLESAMMAARVQYIGIPFIASLLFLFILEYCGVRLRWFIVAAVFFIPVLALVLMQTYTWHNLFYTSVAYTTEGAAPHLVLTGGIFYYIFFGYVYLISVVALVIALYHYHKGDAIFKKQSEVLVGATLVPMFGSALNVMKVGIFDLDVTPIFFTITCLLLGYLIFKLGMYRIAPIAREQIVETMSDGFVLVDMQGQFIDANFAAKKLFPQLGNASVGAKVSQMQGIPWAQPGASAHKFEFSVREPSGITKYYRTSETRVQYQGRDIGRCIMIYDITEARQLLNEVSMMAEHDALTGLFNRGTLFRTGEVMFHQMVEHGGSACLLMMDLDYFKNVNDKYGHIKGDEVLKTISATLASRFRSGDLFARYGGEELCAYLPNANELDITRVANTLRESVEKLKFESDGEVFHITISIGVAIYDPERHHSLEGLIADADSALYAAKNAGRNCVYLAGAAARINNRKAERD